MDPGHRVLSPVSKKSAKKAKNYAVFSMQVQVINSRFS